MAKKIVYVLPGDNIEVRVCDPVFEEGAGKSTWDLSLNPSSIFVAVKGYDSIQVGPQVHVYEMFTNRQMLIK